MVSSWPDVNCLSLETFSHFNFLPQTCLNKWNQIYPLCGSPNSGPQRKKLSISFNLCYKCYSNNWKQFSIFIFLNANSGRDRMVVEFTISAYHCEFEPRSWRGVLDTTLCDKVCQWLTIDQSFSLGSPVSSINKTECHDIYSWNIVESGFKNHNPPQYNLNVDINGMNHHFDTQDSSLHKWIPQGLWCQSPWGPRIVFRNRNVNVFRMKYYFEMDIQL
jgi:hypothetical protein